MHHALVALAATFEVCSTGCNRTGLIMRRSSLAIHSLSDRELLTDVAMAVSRLFASAAHLMGDSEASGIHIKAARRIILEKLRKQETLSEIMELMMPSILALSFDPTDEDELLCQFTTTRRATIIDLKAIRWEYMDFLHNLRHSHWLRLRQSTRDFVLVSWSTICQTISALFSPETITCVVDQPIIPVEQVRSTLLSAGKLQTSSDLKISSHLTLTKWLQYISEGGDDQSEQFLDLQNDLKDVIENYVVLASDIEPRMTAGTYWHDENHPLCNQHKRLLYPQLGKNLGFAENFFPHTSVEAIDPTIPSDHTKDKAEFSLATVNKEVTVRRPQYVCPYLSGFTMAFLR